jgi:hypothetical protein
VKQPAIASRELPQHSENDTTSLPSIITGQKYGLMAAILTKKFTVSALW